MIGKMMIQKLCGYREILNKTKVFSRIFQRVSITLMFMLMTMTVTFACTVTPSMRMVFTTITSADMANKDSEVETSSPGLKCRGAFLAVGIKNDISMQVYGITEFELSNSTTGYKIPYKLYYDKNRTKQVVAGKVESLSSIGLLDLLGLFGNKAINIDLYGTVPHIPGHSLSAGVYSQDFRINWAWDLCHGIGILGACISVSEGSGSGSTIVTVELTITEDCRIYADNIDFGTSPFSSTFDARTGTIRITCTGGVDNYSVGLSEGRNFAGTRQMRSGSDTLAYEIYKGENGGEVWGNQGSARRESGESDTILGARSGQSRVFRYKAEIIPGQEEKPVGLYTDDVVIDITF